MAPDAVRSQVSKHRALEPHANHSQAVNAQAAVYQATTTTFCVLLWITSSAVVILSNKWILTEWNGGAFRLPITLTLWHQAFCSALSFALVRSGAVAKPTISRLLYMRSVVPIGVLFAGTLWFGNAAYQFLQACLRPPALDGS